MAQKSVDEPGFFKVLLGDFETKLVIPPLFLRNIKTVKIETATILSPLGIACPLKVHRDIPNNSLYFGEGWSEFVKAHDLLLGYFLVFSYEGNMVFRLRVFDLSGCQKEYKHGHVAGGVKNKKPKTNNHDQHDVVKGFDGRAAQRHVHGQMTDKVILKSPVTCSYIPQTSGLKTNAIENSQDQKLYQITIRRAHLHPNPHMHIPWSCQAFHGLVDIREAVLVDPEQRSWPVRVYHMKKRTKPIRKPRYFKFGSGWQAFCVNNSLEQGNVCIFVPGAKGVDLIHVQIDRREVPMKPMKIMNTFQECSRRRPATRSTVQMMATMKKLEDHECSSIHDLDCSRRPATRSTLQMMAKRSMKLKECSQIRDSKCCKRSAATHSRRKIAQITGIDECSPIPKVVSTKTKGTDITQSQDDQKPFEKQGFAHSPILI